MIPAEALSITSNDVKLLHQLGHLARMQAGEASPVHVVLCPTNACNLACPHCCFAERDRRLELTFQEVVEALDAFAASGIRSVEFAGGGEPAAWPHLGRVVRYVDEALRLPMGICTNATLVGAVPWERFSWVRLSLNPLDLPGAREGWMGAAREIVGRAKAATACYVVRRDAQAAELERAVAAAVALGVPARLAPDCRAPLQDIEEVLRLSQLELDRLGRPAGVFVSDFNTWTAPRSGVPCRMHLVKPMLAADGWVYACPSFELSPENPADLDPRFRVCHGSRVADFYGRRAAPMPHFCAFCKYERQNQLLHAVCTPVRFEEFV